MLKFQVWTWINKLLAVKQTKRNRVSQKDEEVTEEISIVEIQKT